MNFRPDTNTIVQHHSLLLVRVRLVYQLTLMICQCFLIQIEVHGRIIQTGSLMDVDVEPILGLHLERGLNTGIREDGGR